MRKKDEKPIEDNSSTSAPDNIDEETSEIEDIIEKEMEAFIYPTSPKNEDVKQAQEFNSDVKGWLEVPNTNINHPFMQTDNNTFYLNHDESKEYSVLGSYFADYYATVDSVEYLTHNTVIYGHTGSENPDGKKFSELFAYLDADVATKNPEATEVELEELYVKDTKVKTALADYNQLAGLYIESFKNNLYQLAVDLRTYIEHDDEIDNFIECSAHAQASNDYPQKLC